jgi:hypothetical protein
VQAAQQLHPTPYSSYIVSTRALLKRKKMEKDLEKEEKKGKQKKKKNLEKSSGNEK